METLPKELLIEIVSHLQEDDIASLAKVSLTFSMISQCDSVWKEQCKKRNLKSDNPIETYKAYTLIPVYYLRQQHFHDSFKQVGRIRRSDIYHNRLSSFRIFFNSVLIITNAEKRFLGTIVIGKKTTYNCFKDYIGVLTGTHQLCAWLHTRKHCDKIDLLLDDLQSFEEEHFVHSSCSFDYDIDFNKYFICGLCDKDSDRTYVSKEQYHLPLLTCFNLDVPSYGPIKDYITQLVKSGSALLACSEVYNSDKTEKRWLIAFVSSFDVVKFKFK